MDGKIKMICYWQDESSFTFLKILLTGKVNKEMSHIDITQGFFFQYHILHQLEVSGWIRLLLICKGYAIADAFL